MLCGLFILWIIAGTVGGIIHAIHVLTEQDGRIYAWNVLVGLVCWHITLIVGTGVGIHYLFTRSKYKDFFKKEVFDFGDKEKRSRRNQW
jgi:hypothetical protein